ncbi:hypothetical protein ACSBR1_008410 [Camellia fascicularis]
MVRGEHDADLEFTTTLVFVINMDLSRNNLVGTILEELTVLSGLHGLNLSHNNLTGSIPMKISDLKSLESLDFSSNQLSGTILQNMSTLAFGYGEFLECCCSRRIGDMLIFTRGFDQREAISCLLPSASAGGAAGYGLTHK